MACPNYIYHVMSNGGYGKVVLGGEGCDYVHVSEGLTVVSLTLTANL